MIQGYRAFFGSTGRWAIINVFSGALTIVPWHSIMRHFETGDHRY